MFDVFLLGLVQLYWIDVIIVKNIKIFKKRINSYILDLKLCLKRPS